MTYLEAYAAAMAADEAFSVELVRVYGAKAGDARYWYTHVDAQVTEAGQRKRAADDVLHAMKG